MERETIKRDWIMKVYQTNAALGYNQLAFLIKLKQEDKFLCIGTQLPRDTDSYVIGEVVELENFYIQESSYKIEESPLYGTFLFDHFIMHI